MSPTCESHVGVVLLSSACTLNCFQGSLQGRMCMCPSGYVGSGVGANGCTQSGDACNSNPCLHGTCSVSVFKFKLSYLVFVLVFVGAQRDPFRLFVQLRSTFFALSCLFSVKTFCFAQVVSSIFSLFTPAWSGFNILLTVDAGLKITEAKTSAIPCTHVWSVCSKA